MGISVGFLQLQTESDTAVHLYFCKLTNEDAQRDLIIFSEVAQRLQPAEKSNTDL